MGVMRPVVAAPGLGGPHLTRSRAEDGVCRAYPEGRCLYLVKPTAFAALIDILRQIGQFARSFRGS